MLPFLREHHADPGRLHAEGRVTRVALEEARAQVGAFFGARPREVVFTASGTEAVNTAIFGLPGPTSARPMNFNVIGGGGGGGGGPVGSSATDGGGAGLNAGGGGGGGAFGLKRNRLRSVAPGFGRSASSNSRCTSGDA